jgi:hypothetical protein
VPYDELAAEFVNAETKRIRMRKKKEFKNVVSAVKFGRRFVRVDVNPD